MATFNEFQREIKRRGIDDKNAYMFTLVYERLIETEKLVHDMAGTISHFATLLQGFTNLREADIAQIKKINNHLKGGEGIDVSSVANEPEKN